MKNTYKNYMVQEIFKEEGQEWTIALFQDYQKAIDFAESYVPKDGIRIEIWGTDEDTETYLSADTVYIRNLTYGNSIDLIKLCKSDSDTALKLTSLAYRLYDAEGGDEGGENVNETITKLQSLEGCHSIIEYLLETIDSILE